MTERSVEHATFTLERSYPAAPGRVFAAFADPAAKSRWYLGLEGTRTAEYVLEFRVGGRELSRVGPPGGPVFTAEGRYADIVADQRIVYTYVMDRDGVPISVSLTTVEFARAGEGTRLTLTEHGAYLDGGDQPGYRRQGVGTQLEQLADYLGGQR